MPELPEVETVRRGLAPAMEGARFKKVEVRRPDLRWKLPKDFAKRLERERELGLILIERGYVEQHGAPRRKVPSIVDHAL